MKLIRNHPVEAIKVPYLGESNFPNLFLIKIQLLIFCAGVSNFYHVTRVHVKAGPGVLHARIRSHIASETFSLRNKVLEILQKNFASFSSNNASGLQRELVQVAWIRLQEGKVGHILFFTSTFLTDCIF